MNSLMILQNILLSIKRQNLNTSQKINDTFEISGSCASKLYIICSYFKSLKFFRTAESGRNFGYFAKIAHKVRNRNIMQISK